MSWDGINVLAVVPARGGSKGIARKNMRKVGGVSLIARAAGVIGELGWIDRAVISSDDPDMAEEGRRAGLDAPFMRPADLAVDAARAPDVLRHAWAACEEHYGMEFGYALYLEPTSPLRWGNDVERAMRALAESDSDSAVTVSRAPGHFTPHKCLMVDASGRLSFYLEEGRDVHARQQIPPYYFRNGVAYAVRREPFFRTGDVITDRTLAVVLDRPLVNIDDPLELEFADWLLSRERAEAQ